MWIGVLMNVVEFEESLHHFLMYETHCHRHKLFELDIDLIIGYLNYISKVFFNNCYEFDYYEGLIVYNNCYNCGQTLCNKDKLDVLLKEFKKLYRVGIK